jgi:hypothetical protein
MKIVEISLHDTSQPIVHKEVVNTYTKGGMYCVYVDEVVYKYPLANIWRICESYGKHQGKEEAK